MKGPLGAYPGSRFDDEEGYPGVSFDRFDKTSGMHRIVPYRYLLSFGSGAAMWVVLVLLFDYAYGYASFLAVAVAFGTVLTVTPGKKPPTTGSDQTK